jgi:hypothetical protein
MDVDVDVEVEARIAGGKKTLIVFLFMNKLKEEI